MIEETGSGESTKFLAAADAEPGVYHADVVFPSAGDWRVTILSGFGDSKVTYWPVAIGEPGAGGGASEPEQVHRLRRPRARRSRRVRRPRRPGVPGGSLPRAAEPAGTEAAGAV